MIGRDAKRREAVGVEMSSAEKLGVDLPAYSKERSLCDGMSMRSITSVEAEEHVRRMKL